MLKEDVVVGDDVRAPPSRAAILISSSAASAAAAPISPGSTAGSRVSAVSSWNVGSVNPGVIARW